MELGLCVNKIQELLIVNERVTLPGLGVLVVRTSPATFLQDGRTITPPKKELLFDPSQSDENFEQWQADLSGIIAENLTSDGEYEIPGFGIFRNNGAGEVVFTVSGEFDFAPDSFSLESILLETDVETEIHESEQDENVVEPQEQQCGEELQPECKELLEPEITAEEVQEVQAAGKLHEPHKESEMVERKEKERGKVPVWGIWLIVVVVALAAVVFLAVIFKEELRPLLEKILYTEEELEIIKKWAAR